MAKHLRIGLLVLAICFLSQTSAWSQIGAGTETRGNKIGPVFLRDDGTRAGETIVVPTNLSMLKVNVDELIIGGAAVVATFAAAAGSVLIFVPHEAQVAAFAALVLVAVTPIDGLIIGGGAIAAYRYLKNDALDHDIEDGGPTPAWIDNWRYSVN